jgi:hypothetical protein
MNICLSSISICRSLHRRLLLQVHLAPARPACMVDIPDSAAAGSKPDQQAQAVHTPAVKRPAAAGTHTDSAAVPDHAVVAAEK